MAEFPDLGKHCSLSSCQRLDFTPYLCKTCSNYYCGDHRLSHGCLDSAANSSADVTGVRSSSPDLYPYECSQDGCQKREMVSIGCPVCEKNFCLHHRHAGDHDCKEEVNGDVKKAPSTALPEKLLQAVELDKQQRAAAAIHNPPKRSRALPPEKQKMQDRLDVMRLKGKMQTEKKFYGILEPDRMYIFVKHFEPEERRLPVVVHKKWAVGRCVDHIARVLSIENNNSVPEMKKIRLYTSEDDAEGLGMPEDIVKHCSEMDTLVLKRDL